MSYLIRYSRTRNGQPVTLEGYDLDSPELAIAEFIRQCEASGSKVQEGVCYRRPRWARKGTVMRVYIINGAVMYVGCDENRAG